MLAIGCLLIAVYAMIALLRNHGRPVPSSLRVIARVADERRASA
jgi:hypothetical protein